MQTDCCSSRPGGWSQTILEVKMLDEEVLGWCGYMWSAAVRPVGCTVKILWNAFGDSLWQRNEHSIHGQQLCWTFLQSAGQLHAPSKLATSVALCCVHILEWPAQGTSVQLLCTWYATPVRWMDYLGKGDVLTNTDLDRFVNNIWEK